MYWYRVARNGNKTIMNSVDESFWKNDFRFTRRRLQIQNFTTNDEDLYMCFIKRSTDNYVAEKEMFLTVRGKKSKGPTVDCDKINNKKNFYQLKRHPCTSQLLAKMHPIFVKRSSISFSK